MAVRSDLQMAKSISLVGCDSCQCGNLTIRLHDANGDIFAAGQLTVDKAIAFGTLLTDLIDEELQRDLAKIRCEGVA
ncbi:hypothetical protein [Methylobacterium sp. E-045]|uniref:hypothetical protein n=1 Tax=Methylobacterium sp. E-045 TaxID=2836575 RepID=UPI001FB9BDF3|nr:hypothetical protein [Methylobacterium sp. E-045]MCJ2128198.1 hypothetical protein [Methylobacterium sp. E-045]